MTPKTRQTSGRMNIHFSNDVVTLQLGKYYARFSKEVPLVVGKHLVLSRAEDLPIDTYPRDPNTGVCCQWLKHRGTQEVHPSDATAGPRWGEGERTSGGHGWYCTNERLLGAHLTLQHLPPPSQSPPTHTRLPRFLTFFCSGAFTQVTGARVGNGLSDG